MQRVSARRPSVERLENRVCLSTYWVTNTADAGVGSLRQAITAANASKAASVIDFKIASGAQIIKPLSQLPFINVPVTLDATTQPGYAGLPLIELNGASAGAGSYGLTITGGNSTIKGFVICNFGKFGILSLTKGANTFQNNYVGTDLTGMIKQSNGSHGMLIETGGNTIGGPTRQDRNVISGNGGAGLFFLGPASGHNTVEGNYIGLNAAGTAALANASSGLAIESEADNTIGGPASGDGNVISGNGADGIILIGTSSGNTIQGNLVGTNAAGTTAIGNGSWGLEAQTSGNLVGGLSSADRNVFSGNKMFGVVFYLAGAVHNTLEGNYIGTDITGEKAIGNLTGGVELTNSAFYNTIGGTTPAARNIISGNRTAIALYYSNYNVIEGNYIGLDASGAHGIANATGIAIFNGSSDNTIGGATSGAENIISACTGDGIDLGVAGNTIAENIFGKSAVSAVSLPNLGLNIRNV